MKTNPLEVSNNNLGLELAIGTSQLARMSKMKSKD